jgi:hypothetical protein
MTSSRQTGIRPRRAYILITVLVCLAVVLTLATAWLRTLALERQHARADARGVQAEFLAASALSRAAARLAADADYAGETWRVNADSLAAPTGGPKGGGPKGGGTATITVSALADRPRARRVTAVADFPDEGIHRARRTRQRTIELPPKPSSEDESP